MPKFLIERPLPGAGKLSDDELQAIATKSNQVLHDLGPDIPWLQSYVTEDKIICIYVAPDSDIIFEHARCGGFPAEVVSEVRAIIDPSSGQAA